MVDTTLIAPGFRSALRHLWQDQRVWLASAIILAALAFFDAPQATESAVFAGTALMNTAPFLILSIAIAAWANA
ncbi:MAG: permease, partial [Marivita lacus]|nr:permease [Marivita lacus]